MAQSTSRIDDLDINRSRVFTAFIQLSPTEHIKWTCGSKEDAIEAAKELNKFSKYGRRATVYAVTPEGESIHIRYEYE